MRLTHVTDMKGIMSPMTKAQKIYRIARQYLSREDARYVAIKLADKTHAELFALLAAR